MTRDYFTSHLLKPGPSTTMPGGAPRLAGLSPELLLEISSFLDARSTLQLANAFPILENFLALPTLWRRLLSRADFKDERLVDQMVAFAGEREHLVALLVEALASSFPPLRPAEDMVTISSFSSIFFLSFEGFLILSRASIDTYWTLKAATIELGGSPPLVAALASKASSQPDKLESFSCFHLSCPSSRILLECLSLLENCKMWRVDELEVWQSEEDGWNRLAKSVAKGEVGTLVTSVEDALRKGKEEDLKKVWIATELQWVVSEEEVVEFDKEEDSWSEVQDLVSSQF